MQVQAPASAVTAVPAFDKTEPGKDHFFEPSICVSSNIDLHQAILLQDYC
jgi:hypothetical protein